MHPAFSVIFFTTLSGAGYGLWIACALAVMRARLDTEVALVAMLLGAVLVVVGLSSSLLHLGQPQRAWRAFSQWRSSWLSREGVMAMLTFVPSFGLVAWLWNAPSAAGVSAIALLTAATLIACSLATTVCTAMIYASLPPIPAWRHRLVLPVYLLFALLTGGLLMAAIGGDALGRAPVFILLPLAALLGWSKHRYWRDIDANPQLPTPGAALGLPEREVGVFERPQTEANYLTREMGFVLARKHAGRLRVIAIVLFALVPLLALLPSALLPHWDARPGYLLAAVSALLGTMVERWLFFAQARHTVTLYYGISPK